MTNPIYRSSVIDHITNKFPGEDIGIAYIYCGFKDRDEQTPTKIFASILRQLGYRKSILPVEVEGLYEKLGQKGQTPDLHELVDTIVSVANGFSRVWVFFDALDECDQVSQRVDLLSTIQRFMTTNIGGFATSRSHAEDIQSTFKMTKKIELLARVSDIKSFATGKISARIRDQKLVDEIESQIEKKVDGMCVEGIRSFGPMA